MKQVVFMTVLIGTILLGANSLAETKCTKIDHLQLDGNIVSKCLENPEKQINFTLIEFSSINCSACIANFPTYNRLAKAIKETATTKTIFLDRDRSSVLSYVKKRKSLFQMEIALDDDRIATDAYKIKFTPTTFLLDKNKDIIYTHIGTLDSEDVAKIKKLVK